MLLYTATTSNENFQTGIIKKRMHFHEHFPKVYVKNYMFRNLYINNPYKPSGLFVGHMQPGQIKIRRHKQIRARLRYLQLEDISHVQTARKHGFSFIGIDFK